MRKISELKSLNAGKTMWVLGNGPSLQTLPSTYSFLFNSIGCNRILRTHPAKYVLIVDKDPWETERERIIEAGATLITTQNVYENFVQGKFPEEKVVLFDRSKTAKIGVSEALFYGAYITAFYAAEIAARMVSPHGTVVIAGVDLKYPDGDGPTHSYGYGESEGAAPTRFPEGIAALKKLQIAWRDDVVFLVRPPSALCEGEDPFVPTSELNLV